MYLYFNNTGTLLKSLIHGTPARAGSNNFEIFAYFNGVDISTVYTTGALYLRKPDETGSYTLPFVMSQKDVVFQKTESETTESVSPFVEGTTYRGYNFSFVNHEQVLLDTPGLWKAYIKLYSSGGVMSVEGQITFLVQDGPVDDIPTDYTTEEFLNEILQSLAEKANVKGNKDIRYFGTSTPISSLSTLPTDTYSTGDIVFDQTTKSFYSITLADVTATQSAFTATKIGSTFLRENLILNFDDVQSIGNYNNYEAGQRIFVLDGGVTYNNHSILVKINSSKTGLDLICDYGNLVAKSGDTMTGDLSMGNHKITNIANPTNNGDAMNKGTADSTYVNVSGDTMTGDLNIGTLGQEGYGALPKVNFGSGNVSVGVEEDSEFQNSPSVVLKSLTNKLHVSSFGSIYNKGTGSLRTADLGTNSYKWRDLYLSGSLKDGTNSVGISNIETKSYASATYETKADHNIDKNHLQNQIDALASKSDVVDVVGTYQDLLDYDTSKLNNNDIIKVLVDSTHDNQRSYYRYNKTTNTFSYVGSEGSFYTKSESDTRYYTKLQTNDLLDEKQNQVTYGAEPQNPEEGDIWVDQSVPVPTMTIGYGLSLSESNELSVNTSIIPSLSGNNTFTGTNTFSNGIKADEIKDTSNNTMLDFSNGDVDLGNNDIKTTGNISDGTNSTTVADIANGTFNVINASDIVNNTLTQAQFELFRNGKPTLIKGDYLGVTNPTCFYATDFNTSYYASVFIGQKNNSYQYFTMRFYTINKSNRKIEAASYNYIDLNGIGKINNKSIPAYPANTGTFNLQMVNGAMAWNASQKLYRHNVTLLENTGYEQYAVFQIINQSATQFTQISELITELSSHGVVVASGWDEDNERNIIGILASNNKLYQRHSQSPSPYYSDKEFTANTVITDDVQQIL